MEKQVTFESDGQYVSGVLHYPEKPAPVVISCHGFNGSKSSALHVWFARAMVERGFAVLRIDFRGSGDSQGEFKDQRFSGMLEDIKSTIAFVKTQPKVDSSRIGLTGHSQAGDLVIHAGIMNNELKCISSWSPAGNMMNHFRQAVVDEVYEKGELYLTNDGITISAGYFDDVKKYNVYDAAKALKIPVQVVQGDQDLVCPSSIAKKLFETLATEKEYVNIEGGDHMFGTDKEHEQVLKGVTEWMNRYLLEKSL